MNRWLLSCTIVASLICGSSTFCQAAQPANTPDELIKYLAASASKGEVESFLGYMTEESRKAVQESFANRARLQEHQEQFQRALADRFGKTGLSVSAPNPDFQSYLSRLKAMEIIGRKLGADGSMELRVKSTVETGGGATVSQEDTLLVRRERGEWKLAGSSLATEGHEKAMAERLARQTAALESVTKQVQEGKFKNRELAVSALAQAVSGRPRDGRVSEHQVKIVAKPRPNTSRVAHGAKRIPPENAGKKVPAPADVTATFEHQQARPSH
jgi:hypothetical protein